MEKIIRKLNIFSNKYRGLTIKCAGFLLCIGILAVCASCGEETLLLEADSELDISESPASGAEAEGADEAAGNQEVYLTTEAGEELMMVVHLCGAVNNPGVYELKIDSRVIDGIIKAGGFTEDACEDALNLAMVITDGSRIYVPTVDEVETGNSTDNGTDNSGKYIQSGDSAGTGSDREENGLVNINTAGIDRLITLPGIGESRAKSIIAYREEHGAFGKIEDIMQVSGIKEGAFAKIKDYITVN